MKKLVNHPSDVVREMLEGIARQSPHVAMLGDEHVLIRRPLRSRPSARSRSSPAAAAATSRRMAAMSAREC